MLLSLSIRDFVIIQSLDLTFENGLSALTGETGAGKSILLDALGIVLGRRGESGLIRKGSEQAIVTAEFSLASTSEVQEKLKEQGIEFKGTILIKRLIYANGRSKAFINEHPVSVSFLKQLADSLVEIHGQFDRLMDVSSHRSLLDAYVQNPQLLQHVKFLFHEWKNAESKVYEAEERLDHLKRHEDFLRYQLKELESLNLTEGEEEELLAKREGLSGFAKLFDAVSQAYSALENAQVQNALDTARRALQKIPEGSSQIIDLSVKALNQGFSEVTEALAQLEDLHQQIDDQPQQLQIIDDRLHLLRGISRKHNITIADLPSFYDNLKHDLEDLELAENKVEHLRIQSTKAMNAYLVEAKKLHDSRCQKAVILDNTLMKELPELKLPNAQFKTEITELSQDNWHEAGIDRINFLVAMNKGQSLCPIEKAASGGELARLMLSLKSILATVSNIDTILFDEIDIGVGGAVAAAIGHRLVDLSKHVQVLVITHSPQVAATADHQYQVSKQDHGAEVLTNVIELPLPKRHEELARMLSGEEVTDEARAAAKKLLARYG